MRYLVQIESDVEKEIEKIKDRELQKNIKNKINKLSENPLKGKHLFLNHYELRAKNYRIYYEIYKGIVVVESVSYDGRTIVNKIGTKNTQTRDIQSLQ